MKKSLRLVLMGMMGQSPFGGQAWMHLNWMRGFQRLGHDVWYIEDSTAWPYDPVEDTLSDDCRHAVQHISRCMDRIGLGDRWGYRLGDRPDRSWGLTPAGDARGLPDQRRTGEHYRRDRPARGPLGGAASRLRRDRPGEHPSCGSPTAMSIRGWRSAITIAIVDVRRELRRRDCGVPLNGIRYREDAPADRLELWPDGVRPDRRTTSRRSANYPTDMDEDVECRAGNL